nr:hypothetical protein [Tanacetum cinerariifolium]
MPHANLVEGLVGKQVMDAIRNQMLRFDQDETKNRLAQRTRLTESITQAQHLAALITGHGQGQPAAAHPRVSGPDAAAGAPHGKPDYGHSGAGAGGPRGRGQRASICAAAAARNHRYAEYARWPATGAAILPAHHRYQPHAAAPGIQQPDFQRHQDDGPGIAPEYHERIFVIFQT